MSLKYACFISYRAARQPLAEQFLREFYEGLSAELEALVKNDLFLDWSRLQSPDTFTGQTARALCESACMIAIYTPNYFSATYSWTSREFAAMEKIEKHRLAFMPDKSLRLILPVIFRGGAYMPPSLASRQSSDFSDFVLSGRSMRTSSRYARQLQEIAQWIAAVNRQLAELPPELLECKDFQLPTEDESRPYIEFQAEAQRPPVPWRTNR